MPYPNMFAGLTGDLHGGSMNVPVKGDDRTPVYHDVPKGILEVAEEIAAEKADLVIVIARFGDDFAVYGLGEPSEDGEQVQDLILNAYEQLDGYFGGDEDDEEHAAVH